MKFEDQKGKLLYEPDFCNDWKRRSLYDLAKWKNGLAFKDINFSDVGKPVIKIAELNFVILWGTTMDAQLITKRNRRYARGIEPIRDSATRSKEDAVYNTITHLRRKIKVTDKKQGMTGNRTAI
ncbi:hypothetical protein [Caproicibacterium sp. BJN0003]|uniref:hypothetical protein n=1 Tax=Caproicibacterium sp. BJN0003 TaxID=2994078 RepID=UPI00224E12CD|nr:hypothetical protein [Caproicibacterium sp. BJN0003]UZT81607.1 hypothetical protein OP489_08895 [Caproicibacterium sp. BJN0003]